MNSKHKKKNKLYSIRFAYFFLKKRMLSSKRLNQFRQGSRGAFFSYSFTLLLQTRKLNIFYQSYFYKFYASYLSPDVFLKHTLGIPSFFFKNILLNICGARLLLKSLESVKAFDNPGFNIFFFFNKKIFNSQELDGFLKPRSLCYKNLLFTRHKLLLLFFFFLNLN